MKKMIALLGMVVLAAAMCLSPAAAAQPRSAKDSLSADGPYILYGSNGVEVISVDVQGEISRKHWDQLPDGYTFRVTDHRGKYPFQVSLRPFARQEWQRRDIPQRTFVMSDPHGKLDCVIDLLRGNRVIDDGLEWAYGTNRLVVIGDIADRGKDMTAIYWFFYKLQQEAEDAGGSVVMLLGNHEPMGSPGTCAMRSPSTRSCRACWAWNTRT